MPCNAPNFFNVRTHSKPGRGNRRYRIIAQINVQLLYLKTCVLTSSQICKFNAQSALTSDSEVACSIRPPTGVENSPVEKREEKREPGRYALD